MPHLRHRFITDIFLKRLTFSPVVAIQGARQTGKSVFAREILTKELKNTSYLTLDRPATLAEASRDVESFLVKNDDYQPLMIDEAQKLPVLFDAIKFQVDLKRRPGKYVLLGSTEFSILNQIREALTGRMSRVRFYPLTFAESLEKKFKPSSEAFYLSKNPSLTKKEFITHLDCGGFPGIFAIRSETERAQSYEDWINLTCERDIHQFPKIKLDSNLCKLLLQFIATLGEPNAANLAKAVRTNAAKVNKHLLALETLFAIQSLPANTLGSGKPIYYLADVGLCSFLGGSYLRKLETLFLQEWNAKKTFHDNPKDKRVLSYYRTSHGARVSFVEESPEFLRGITIFDQIKIDTRSFYPLFSLEEAAIKNKLKNIELYSTGPMDFTVQKKVKHYSFEQWG